MLGMREVEKPHPSPGWGSDRQGLLYLLFPAPCEPWPGTGLHVNLRSCSRAPKRQSQGKGAKPLGQPSSLVSMGLPSPDWEEPRVGALMENER